jgi:hypothetical protein
VIPMWDNGKKAKHMDMECMCGLMETDTKGNGVIVKSTDMALMFLLMETYILDTI